MTSNHSNSNTDLEILIDSKEEYTKQLSLLLVKPILSYFFSKYQNILKTTDNPKNVLKNFQNSLSNISKLSEENKKKLANLIINKMNCEYFDDMVTAVFVSYTKVLSYHNWIREICKFPACSNH